MHLFLQEDYVVFGQEDEISSMLWFFLIVLGCRFCCQRKTCFCDYYEVTIMFKKNLEGPTGSWVCKLRSSSSDRLEDPISTMWALRTSSHIRQACSMLISPCVVIWGLLLSTPFKLVWLLWRGSLLGQLKKAVLYSRKIKKICRGWIHFLWGQLLPSKANI